MVHANTHKYFAWGLTALLCSSLIFISTAQAQSILLEPAGDGGFENGVDFSSNGWTLVNNIAENQSGWHIDAAVNTAEWVMPVSNSAFISDSLGLNWTYNSNWLPNSGVGTKASTVHFYRDINFPAGETNIKLSFDLLCNGEGFNYDVFYVWLCPVSLTPSVNSPVASSDIAVWSGTGEPTIIFKQQGTSSSSVRPVSSINITIPSALIDNCSESTSMRLVFGWKNDESLQFDPPVAIDNISLSSNAESFTEEVKYYTINNSLPVGTENFINFSSAISYLNAAAHCSTLLDSIIFEVSADQQFIENLPVITATGYAYAPIIFRKSGSGSNPVILSTGSGSFEDAGIAISGGDYFTFDGIDVKLNSGMDLEFGYMIHNGSPNNGASQNTIKNCEITLTKKITKSIGILQSASYIGAGFDPTTSSGANDGNKYQNVTVKAAYNGILITNQSALFPDNETEVSDCKIGAVYTGTPSGDLGGAGVSVYGIQLKNQKNCIVTNNVISNLTSIGTSVRGIYVLNGIGTITISRNKVNGLRNTSESNTSAAIAYDIMLNTEEVFNVANVYNNFASDITCAYAGSSTFDRAVKGIILRGGNAGSVFNIDFNSISINTGSSIKVSSVVLEVTSVIPKINIRNNIFANYTPNQTGNCGHYLYATPFANQIAAAGSVINYNVYHLPSTTKGFFARANATNVSTFSAWKTNMSLNPGMDVNSFQNNPLFLNPVSNLHATASSLNATANMTGITWVNTDFDGDIRALTPDIGADEFSTSTIDLELSEILIPSETICYNSSDSITIQIHNIAAHTLNFLGNPCTISVSVTGPISYSSAITINTGTISAFATEEIKMPLTFDFSTPGDYTITASNSTTGDVNSLNDIIIEEREVTIATVDMPYEEDFNLSEETPEGWVLSGFEIGKHIGASESNQIYSNISEANPTDNFTIRKIGPVSENALVSFDYRMLDFLDSTITELDPLWGEIVVSASIDCGEQYTQIGLITSTTHPFVNVQFPISAFDGYDIIIKIEANWGGGTSANFWLDIDKINIYNSTCEDPLGNTVLNPIDIGDLSEPYTINENNLVSNCWSNDYGYSSPDIFYKFTPVCAGALTLSLCGSDFNTVLYLLDPEYDLLSSNDDFCGTSSELEYSIETVGVPYYIVVEGKTSASGNFSLNAELLTTAINYYTDFDEDGYGDISNTFTSCIVGLSGYATNALDCNDLANHINPSAIEICDGIDNDCDGEADDNTASATISQGASVAICKGTSIILNANTGVGYNYSWFKNGNLISGATGSSYTTQKAGNYQVQVNFPSQCFAISAITIVIVNPLPVVSITAPFGLSLCTYVGLSATVGTGYVYQWFKNGNLIAGATNLQYHPVSVGSFYCRITDANGCIKNTNVLVTVACKEDSGLSGSEYFSLSPNPASDLLQIDLQVFTQGEEIAIIEVLNALGQVINEHSEAVSNGKLITKLSVNELPKGIYHIVVTFKNEKYINVVSIVR